MTEQPWKLQSGANVTPGGIEFSVWALNAGTVSVEIDHADRTTSSATMESEGEGRFSVTVPSAKVGDRYRYRLDGGEAYPDPYSRFQPDSVHGSSEIVDPSAFPWNDKGWIGLDAETLSIYELHVGTFSKNGTFADLEYDLAELQALGVTAIELMPVAQTPGSRNWGYDGVDLFAPNHVYGTPDELRRLVNAAHRVGLGVILDVVYNHLGPEGSYLSAYSSAYFSDRHQTDWGAGLNWDGEHNYWVRQFAIDNACYWISEFHIDGLRLDATHAMIDDSDLHIVQELAEAARAASGGRNVLIIAEDGRHDIKRVRPVERDGEGLDGVWADDFHHQVRVLLSNAHESYYSKYEGTTTGLADVVEHGFAHLVPDGSGRTEDTDPASVFVFCIQNHDQVGNRPFGERLHHEINVDRYRVASALLLFVPETLLIFMGQEFVASTPFLYFTDHPPELGQLVTEGRRREFAGFRAFDDPEVRETIPDPQDDLTFLRSKLNLEERRQNPGILELYRTMLWMRRRDAVLSRGSLQQSNAWSPNAQVVIVHRWHDDQHRVLIANFGQAASMPAEWFADVPSGLSMDWSLEMQTAESRFGGQDHRVTLAGDEAVWLNIPARTAAVFSFASTN
jgi:maltooligosyltrehalose trehalohydrolase